VTVSIVTDSTNYIPDEDLRADDIRVVPLFVHDGASLSPETQIDLDAFYRRLEDTRVLPTSSQPSPETIAASFREAFDTGADAVLGVFLSSRMSGTVQAAELAAAIVADERGSAPIEVLDSESNCMQEGFAVLSAADAALAGADIDECARAARETMARTRFLFSPTSLEYLRRGGRISGASTLLGGLLQISPILTVAEGETTAVARVRTHKRAMIEMGARMSADVEQFGLRRAIVHSIAAPDIAERFASEIVQPIAGRPVRVVPVGPVIGLHVGPAVGVVYETLEPLRG
jgi:DegV family protein with EDD domain